MIIESNPTKDPLPHALKIAYMRKMFPKHARKIIADQDATTAMAIATKLYDEGYKNLVMVAGSDRIKEFQKLLHTYNGVKGKRHGYYKFASIDVVSAGERDPDAEGVTGMSASKMRSAAASGDISAFKRGLPKGFKGAERLFKDLDTEIRNLLLLTSLSFFLFLSFLLSLLLIFFILFFLSFFS